jgi:peptidoglycan/xylan/chitin deacetylase (PgdA/CDA1 family)
MMKINKVQPGRKKVRIGLLCLLFLCLLFLNSCSDVFRVALAQDFVIVDVKQGDSLSSISKTYLGDPNESWRIAEFNNIRSVSPGQRIIVPLAGYRIGGLYKDGYQTVPVLVYNNFFEKNSNNESKARKIFQAQMSYLKKNGYSVISVDRFMNFLDLGVQLHPKSVVITIDDVWEPVYSVAYPILKENGFPAALFVTTDLIGREGALTWDKIGEMNVNGISIYSKTKTHRDLLKPEKGESDRDYKNSLENELLHSKKIIEKNILRECKYLAYPYGFTNGMIITWAKRYGYLGGFTISNESNPFFANKFFINRIKIRKQYGINKFKNNLSLFRKKALK